MVTLVLRVQVLPPCLLFRESRSRFGVCGSWLTVPPVPPLPRSLRLPAAPHLSPLLPQCKWLIGIHDWMLILLYSASASSVSVSAQSAASSLSSSLSVEASKSASYASKHGSPSASSAASVASKSASSESHHLSYVSVLTVVS